MSHRAKYILRMANFNFACVLDEAPSDIMDSDANEFESDSDLDKDFTELPVNSITTSQVNKCLRLFSVCVFKFHILIFMISTDSTNPHMLTIKYFLHQNKTSEFVCTQFDS